MADLLKDLNDAQKKAVVAMDGPMMVIAGAGSGKTRVLTYKVAYLISHGVDPFNILALTFTNKAAMEMKNRVAGLVGSEAQNVWMGTFHSVFARLLRRDGNNIGYPSNFSIYDTDDSKSALKQIITDFGLDPKVYATNIILSRISAAKSSLISADEYAKMPEAIEHDKASNRPEIYRIYKAYQEKLFRASAMDFDDIIFNFFLLITRFPQVLEKYRRSFKYILIDEFQDTNKAQYYIVKLLAEPLRNLCVVGDDAQSIYAFRGANIENILGFRTDYPEYKLFKLEQNYRSTTHIVELSNSIIAKNKNQIQKKVWTDNGEGELIRIIQATTDGEEASKVASAIFERKMNEHVHNDAFAILYRTNAQSRSFEEALRRMNIPYIIYGGLSFYQRKEIKDLLAYFRLTINHFDEEALNRIINYPAREIGKTTMEKIQNAAAELKVPVWNVLSDYQKLLELRISSRTASKIEQFVIMIENFSHKLRKQSAQKMAKEIAAVSGIVRNINEDKTPEGISRMNNIEELINAIGDFSEKRNALTAIDNLGEIDDSKLITLDMFMQDVALLTDADKSDDEDTDKVQLMTIHAAKGLEFQNVFVVGLEENLFPSAQNIYSREDLEEERRLFYVACTRAQHSLALSYAENRYKWGQLQMSEPSRFLKDLDYAHINVTERAGSRFSRLSGPSISGFDMSFDNQPRYGRHDSHYSPSDYSRPQSGNYQQSRSGYSSSQSDYSRSQSGYPKSDTNLRSGTSQSNKPQTGFSSVQYDDSLTPKPVADYGIFKPGDKVYHEKFHRGVILSLEGTGPNRKAEVDFEGIGKKMLLLRFAKLAMLE